MVARRALPAGSLTDWLALARQSGAREISKAGPTLSAGLERHEHPCLVTGTSTAAIERRVQKFTSLSFMLASK